MNHMQLQVLDLAAQQVSTESTDILSFPFLNYSQVKTCPDEKCSR